MQARIKPNGEQGRTCDEGLQGIVDASRSLHQPSTTLLTPLASVYNPRPFPNRSGEGRTTNEKENTHASDSPGWRKNGREK
jgi:hypothetical protein